MMLPSYPHCKYWLRLDLLEDLNHARDVPFSLEHLTKDDARQQFLHILRAHPYGNYVFFNVRKIDDPIGPLPGRIILGITKRVLQVFFIYSSLKPSREEIRVALQTHINDVMLCRYSKARSPAPASLNEDISNNFKPHDLESYERHVQDLSKIVEESQRNDDQLSLSFQYML